MSPYDVMHPAKGENVTVWAKREADHRSGKRAAANPSYSRSLLALLRFFRGMIADVRPLCV
jgi:hypothetical protein